MIHEVTMYAAICDNCGEDWECRYFHWKAVSSKGSLKANLKDADWHIAEDDNCYCDKCHFAYQDEDGEDLVDIRTDRKKVTN